MHIGFRALKSSKCIRHHHSQHLSAENSAEDVRVQPVDGLKSAVAELKPSGHHRSIITPESHPASFQANAQKVLIRRNVQGSAVVTEAAISGWNSGQKGP